MSIADGLSPVVSLAVIQSEQPWEVLVSAPDLERLDVILMTPAMLKRAKHFECRQKKDSTVEPAPSFTDTTIEREYEQMPDPAIAAVEEATRDAAVELIPNDKVDTDPRQDTAKINQLTGHRKMRVRLGLPADFFVYERDANFEHWDAMYPPVSRENVASRIVHQITDTDKANRLLDVLMSAATAMREYPSGCPPPAAVQPIRPPMRENPKMLYTIQHKMSEAAWDAREKFVKTRLEYGIDEYPNRQPTQRNGCQYRTIEPHDGIDTGAGFVRPEWQTTRRMGEPATIVNYLTRRRLRA
ncbi:hypothetical protein IW150_000434 [Coemansia sp. RSA 2607]|nr:hypothetical protein IW150_000434 [Coemansia sp. RSA 2607]